MSAGGAAPCAPSLAAFAPATALAVVGIGLAVVLAIWRWDLWLGLFVALAGIVAAGVIAALRVRRWLVRDLAAADFGLCPGSTQPGHGFPGFTDWICRRVDAISGKRGGPLTVGDLEDHGIEVAAMTTDLSTGRPYQLPLKSRIHYFSRSEFMRLFEPSFVDHLCAVGGPHAGDGSALPAADLHHLPVGRDFPVALVARMSLSFPVLISAIPLYRYDDQLGPDHPCRMRRCLFSDGGISSNFPIHFFDALLPARPTFGVSLGVFDAERHTDADRVSMVERAPQSTDLPVRSIASLGAFAGSIVNTAKDWQDTLQSMLPGYADRIVTIRLDPAAEGGMNLAMGPETIKRLTELGGMAGRMLVNRFSYARGATGFDQHRYYRAVSLLPRLEGALEGFADALGSAPSGAPAAPTTRRVMIDFDSAVHPLPQGWRRNPFAAFADALAGIARGGSANHEGPSRKRIQDRRKLPRFDAALRLAALADREPRSHGSAGAGGESDRGE